MRRGWVYAAFVLGVLACGLAIGMLARPDGWYAALAKPPFNPPEAVFAPVWVLLYVLIGIAGARAFLGGATYAFGLWAAQMALNFVWTPVFFVLHQPLAALAVITVLLGTILAFIVVQRRDDPLAAVLFAPYAAWVGFAAMLNAAIVALN